MPFEKGQSGNPGGRPKEVAEVKALAREHGEAAIERMVEIMLDDGAPRKTQLAAAIALLDRGYGRPSQTVDVDLTDSLGLVELMRERRARALERIDE